MDAVPIFYGLCVFTALGLALLARRTELIKLGLILVSAWVSCNLAVAAHGFSRATMLIPTIDAILALLAAWMVAIERSKPAGIVFALFVMVEIVHVAAFQTHTQGGFAYFLTLNVLFFCQVVVVGGWSAWALVDRLADPPRMASRVSRGWLRHGADTDSRPHRDLGV